MVGIVLSTLDMMVVGSIPLKGEVYFTVFESIQQDV